MTVISSSSVTTRQHGEPRTLLRGLQQFFQLRIEPTFSGLKQWFKFHIKSMLEMKMLSIVIWTHSYWHWFLLVWSNAHAWCDVLNHCNPCSCTSLECTRIKDMLGRFWKLRGWGKKSAGQAQWWGAESVVAPQGFSPGWSYSAPLSGVTCLKVRYTCLVYPKSAMILHLRNPIDYFLPSSLPVRNIRQYGVVVTMFH